MMYLKRLIISNYKSFLEPTEFNFEPGFNVLLGANSSGKSSVLEAINFKFFQYVPHRSILNMPESEGQNFEKSTSEVHFTGTIQQITKLANPTQDLFVCIGDDAGNFFFSNDVSVLDLRLKNEHLMLSFRSSPMDAGNAVRLSFDGRTCMWRSLNNPTRFPGLHVRNSEALSVNSFSNDAQDAKRFWEVTSHKIYKFSAERVVQHQSPHYPSGELEPNASNLAYCVAHLQTSNPDLFAELNSLLHRVFPTIHWVGAPPNGGNAFELKVHTNPTLMKRADLAVPISHVGTGVGNALAMLYVALTAQTQRYILLEEPNSYLHPRALRELLAILSEIGGKHQFFITTHSSDVLRTIDASTVTLLEYDGQQTIIKQTTGDRLHELQAGLMDLGISLTDLHGCDRILWVEGETEAAIFPLLLRHFFPTIAQGIAVLPLHATGDFEAKKYEAKKVAQIYKTLSQGSFLAPPMVAIALDRERKSNSQIKQMEADCAGVVHFLPRTMLEDYLLVAEAIAYVVSQELKVPLSLVQVTEALRTAMADKSCLLTPNNTESKEVHAAKVLHFVFEKIASLEYRKTAHGPKIAEWLLINKPEELTPLRAWFDGFIDKVN